MQVASGSAWWLGTVVPKRHARRAVTRSLLKRQIRLAFAACFADLDPGLWIVRVRTGFDRKQFPSAASTALRQAAGDELQRLLAACRGTGALRTTAEPPASC
jgi:ribonuclease P protein component